MNDSNKKEQFYKNLVGLFKNFTGRNLHLVKFLIENKAFNEDFIEKVINNPEMKDRLYKRICDAYIFKYQAGIDGGIDDVIIVNEVIDEEG